MLGDRDLEAGTIQLKDLGDGTQTEVALADAAAAVDRALEG